MNVDQLALHHWLSPLFHGLRRAFRDKNRHRRSAVFPSAALVIGQCANSPVPVQMIKQLATFHGLGGTAADRPPAPIAVDVE